MRDPRRDVPAFPSSSCRPATRMLSEGPPLGNDAIAAVFGGIASLVLSGAALVLRRDHLRAGPAFPAWAWVVGGGGFGAVVYLLGLLVYGRCPEMLQPGAVWGACWTVSLLAVVGAPRDEGGPS